MSDLDRDGHDARVRAAIRTVCDMPTDVALRFAATIAEECCCMLAPDDVPGATAAAKALRGIADLTGSQDAPQEAPPPPMAATGCLLDVLAMLPPGLPMTDQNGVQNEVGDIMEDMQDALDDSTTPPDDRAAICTDAWSLTRDVYGMVRVARLSAPAEVMRWTGVCL